ncbi:hypothetical protein LLG96_01260 [bacterium]|nr:hypothetical protein [bacterium]
MIKPKLLVSAIVLVVVTLYPTVCPAPAFKSPDEQREMEKKYDRKNILRSAEMITDTSPEFIAIPKDYPEVMDFDVAKTPPTVDFAIVQGLDPLYLPSFDSVKGGVYGGWGDVTKGPDGCFYFSIGNHMSYGGTAYIIRYDPSKKKQSIVVDLKKVVGYSDKVFGDGKFHGDPDIGPGGEMWLLSYFGPMPTKEELDTVYRGSWLIRYNIFSGKTENMGIPLEGESWPYYAYDWERRLLFGVGSINGYVIAYDTKEQRMIYGGSPKNGITWYERGVLLDRDTGIIYSTDSKMYPGETLVDRYRGEQHFVNYERRNNKFTIMKATVPPNPVTGKITPMRAHTKDRGADGAFWCFDVSGAMFKFYPDEDRTEPVGINWGKEGKYTSNMNFSPKKRYIYYLPGADTRAYQYGTPVVQYDTKTGRRKVIAFLNDFYLNTYGYSPGGTYGVELDEKGESLFFYTNGRFTARELGSGYGRPAIFHLHIPESERVE